MHKLFLIVEVHPLYCSMFNPCLLALFYMTKITLHMAR